MIFDSGLWTGLREKVMPTPKQKPLRTETMYVPVRRSNGETYISNRLFWLAREARQDIAAAFYPNKDWHAGWKMAKNKGWRIKRAHIELEPGQ